MSKKCRNHSEEKRIKADAGQLAPKNSKALRDNAGRERGFDSHQPSQYPRAGCFTSRKGIPNERPQILHQTQHPAVPTDSAGSHSLQRLPVCTVSVEWRVFGSTEPSRHHDVAPVFLVATASGEARKKSSASAKQQ